VNHFVPSLPPGHHFGFSTREDENFTRVHILSLIPGSFAALHLTSKNVVGMYLLVINGIPIHTTNDISDVIEDILDRKPDEAHCTLTGFNFLFGKLTDEDQHDDLSLQAPDQATARVVMALTMLTEEALDTGTLRTCDNYSKNPIRPPYCGSLHQDLDCSGLLFELAVISFRRSQRLPIDVHNAFQSTPDPGDIHDNRAYLRINREWLEFIKHHKPEWWHKVKDLLAKHSVSG
jgi:hypothetical protein